MKYDKIAKSLKGEDLMNYLLYLRQKKGKYRDIANAILMLERFYCGNTQKLYSILEDMVQKDKELVAIYTWLGEEPTKGMECVGGILDGGLYIK